ncbi:TonB-dependent receptor [Thermococcus peptonophilus]|uniref:TonB-dependent receptor n=1 Tax=Thermococcus peptonophilus TaxID=53952 RepID=UPI0009ED5F13|nr:TonB-dependent receptor [Thermococcus peptonophilus]
MGHTIYYNISIQKWYEFTKFINRVCSGIGYQLKEENESLIVFPQKMGVEPLRIKKDGVGFAKTNLIEPEHSIYLLILHSVSSFGSVSVWED